LLVAQALTENLTLASAVAELGSAEIQTRPVPEKLMRNLGCDAAGATGKGRR